MNVALVADWLPVYAGAEHVIHEFTELFPHAPLYTTIANHKKLGPLQEANIITSPLQKWYRLLGRHHYLLPWMPQAIERIDLRGYEVILSSSHAIGKGIVPPSSATHICYCHTPMRYAWEMEKEYIRDFHIPSFLQKNVRRLLKNMRRWDMTTAKRVDTFIANSSTTQERIRRVYNRESTVIHPPVRDRFFKRDKGHVLGDKGKYFLAVGRLVPYKRFDLLIETANVLQLPLKIAGAGLQEKHLRSIAGPTVEILGFIPDSDLPQLYANAEALLFPQFEDAGVVPLEAQACGTPVIAFGAGGALDTVREGETGLFFEEQSTESLSHALETFRSLTFSRDTIKEHARTFSSTTFQKRILDVIHQHPSHPQSPQQAPQEHLRV